MPDPIRIDPATEGEVRDLTDGRCPTCGDHLDGLPAGLRRPGRSPYRPCAVCLSHMQSEPERFDEYAADLDTWRADQAALKAREETLHARMDRAIQSGYRSALDRPGSPAPLVDILPERSAARDSWTLDRLAEEARDFCAWMREASPDPNSLPAQGIMHYLDTVEDLIRSTGREC